MSLDQKIDALFDLRRIPALVRNSKIDLGSTFYNGLIDLQKEIYYLDAHLESNWKIDLQELEPYWNKICTSLLKLGVKEGDLEDYLSSIKRYQKHELQLREGKMPFEYTIDYFYYYKSCDVKLIRRLIYDQIPILDKMYPLKDWRIFDLVTEIHDDVEDVFEDVEVYNGNAFLLNVNSRGLENTIQIFREYINNLEQDLDLKYRNTKVDSQIQLYELTKEAFMQLNVLILKQYDTIKDTGLGTNKVIKELSISID